MIQLNLAIRSSWSEPQSAPGLVFADCIELLHFGCKEYNQSDFGVDHLVMSMCRVFSCVVGRGCLLWPGHFLGKTLLVFALLHSVFQGQICLLLQVFLDFLLLCSSFLKWKGHLFWVLILKGLVGLHRTIQFQLLQNSAVATGLEKVSFHSNPKERHCQRMLKLPHNCTHLTR